MVSLQFVKPGAASKIFENVSRKCGKYYPKNKKFFLNHFMVFILYLRVFSSFCCFLTIVLPEVSRLLSYSGYYNMHMVQIKLPLHTDKPEMPCSLHHSKRWTVHCIGYCSLPGNPFDRWILNSLHEHEQDFMFWHKTSLQVGR